MERRAIIFLLTAVVGSTTVATEPDELYVPGEVIVLYSVGGPPPTPGVDADVRSTVEAFGGEVVRTISFPVTRFKVYGIPGYQDKRSLKVRLPAGKTVEEAISERWGDSNPHILAVEPNYRCYLLSTPNDPAYGSLWAMPTIEAPRAWDETTGSREVIVAVIDTGIDYDHPDLKENMWINPGEDHNPVGEVGPEDFDGVDDDNNLYVDDLYGYDFVNRDNDPMDDDCHGTHCAGIIGAVGDNAIGVVGVNWQVRLMACKSLRDGTIEDAIDAINYAVKNGARILNNSWGWKIKKEKAASDPNTKAKIENLRTAVENAQDNGVLFVVVIPNTAVFWANKVFSIEHADTINRRIYAAKEDLRRNAPEGSDSSNADDPFTPEHRLRAELRMKYLNTEAAVRRAYFRDMFRQLEHTRLLTAISPIALFDYAHEAVVGGGYVRFRKTWDDLHEYQSQFLQFFKMVDAQDPNSPHWYNPYEGLSTTRKPVNFAEVPVFEEKPVLLADRLLSPRNYLAMIVAHTAVVLSLAFVLFLRYDVR